MVVPAAPTIHTFQGLNPSVKLIPVEKDSKEFKQIETYFSTTQGHTHNMNAELLDILRIERPDDRPYIPGEKTLLWHGTKRNHLTSILNHGLLMDPPGQVQKTGQMFGKGVYFADSFSKSANYSMKGDAQGNAYIFLAEVALGKMFPLFESVTQEAINLIVKSGFDSVKGCGRNYAPKSGFQYNGLQKIPSGKLETNQYVEGGLIYNEYIVYDDNRIRIKYLVYIKDNNRLGF